MTEPAAEKQLDNLEKPKEKTPEEKLEEELQKWEEGWKELTPFLDLNARFDLKVLALEYALGATGSPKGREIILSLPDLLRQLIILVQDKCEGVAIDAAKSIVNISGDEAGASALLIIAESSKSKAEDKENDNIIYLCLKNIIDKESAVADRCCMILSNMTRPKHFVERILTLADKSGIPWSSVVNAFMTKDYNTSEYKIKLHYLGPLFSNLSQSKKMRDYLLDKDQCVIQRLLAFTEFEDSLVRRGGIAGTLKNCCFDFENHEWLLGSDVDILPALLLPLAGPEQFTDEENDKLPVDLQFLPETKKRERDPDIRIILLEALGQLCTTKKGREYLREKNAYVILRELHKWEKDKQALLACENVVDILIKTEEEIGHDNLKEIDVPEKYKEKFEEMDKEFLVDDEQMEVDTNDSKKEVQSKDNETTAMKSVD